ncbi:MAG: pseudouridine synthase [Candidatus Nitrohelix vancouverensis]|uniref:Pseudouridine synthase n=1 Tax=Candidatus Nitrohelix vancouverensis TaxID=2705534 RepID=A0A7T0C1T3_9BACT|nr:MAG: pseudouridine synthase [Candidatus Nitrohelix vancouverensis]
MKIRLQKIIADAGLGSRREAERWITEGKVKVNGQVETKLGSSADPKMDLIRVNGKALPSTQEKVYILFNKPGNCLTTMTTDARGRMTVMDFLKKAPIRVFPVGRLDYNTQGLLLCTNDGDLSKKLLEPRYAVERTYLVKVRGVPNDKSLARIRKGIWLDEKPTAPVKVEIQRTSGKNCFLILRLTEGKNRHVKRICEAVRHPVIRLKRTHFAGLSLDDLPLGAFRFLSPREIRSLHSAVAPSKSSARENQPAYVEPTKPKPRKDLGRDNALGMDKPRKRVSRTGAPTKAKPRKDLSRASALSKSSARKNPRRTGAPSKSAPRKTASRAGAPSKGRPRAKRK